MAKERTIDKAKEYREQFGEDMRQRAAAHVPELAGLTPHKLKRFLYLQLKVGETPRQQSKAVFAEWKRLFSVHDGGFQVCVWDAGWQLALPTGETFLDHLVVRTPAFDWETEEMMVPHVDLGEREFRAFAAATGRRVGTIEDQWTFACDDGRRIPLAACTYRLLTDADYAPAKSRKRSRPAESGS